jgi:lysophospholipid acyltransferase (LPLAT)-like uncharacterized protein
MPNMKIRAPWLIKAAGFAGSWLVRLLVGTLRFRYYGVGQVLHPHAPGLRQRYIYCFWHENMLLLAYHFGRPDVLVLISQHADGQLIAEICRHLGFGLVRGSTTRGGVEALRQMIRAGQDAHVAITPDGPKGPRREVQPGLVYLAARTGLEILPIGVGYRRPWRMRSWDQFAVPRPGTFATCVNGAPIRIPETADREQLERYRLHVQDALRRASDVAERWAEQGGPAPPTDLLRIESRLQQRAG